MRERSRARLCGNGFAEVARVTASAHDLSSPTRRAHCANRPAPHPSRRCRPRGGPLQNHRLRGPQRHGTALAGRAGEGQGDRAQDGVPSQRHRPATAYGAGPADRLRRRGVRGESVDVSGVAVLRPTDQRHGGFRAQKRIRPGDAARGIAAQRVGRPASRSGGGCRSGRPPGGGRSACRPYPRRQRRLGGRQTGSPLGGRRRRGGGPRHPGASGSAGSTADSARDVRQYHPLPPGGADRLPGLVCRTWLHSPGDRHRRSRKRPGRPGGGECADGRRAARRPLRGGGNESAARPGRGAPPRLRRTRRPSRGVCERGRHCRAHGTSDLDAEPSAPGNRRGRDRAPRRRPGERRRGAFRPARGDPPAGPGVLAAAVPGPPPLLLRRSAPACRRRRCAGPGPRRSPPGAG